LSYSLSCASVSKSDGYERTNIDSFDDVFAVVTHALHGLETGFLVRLEM
jgi:hypothetical protein